MDIWVASYKVYEIDRRILLQTVVINLLEVL